MAANENRRKKSEEAARERHLALVKVWVPKDKVVEIKSLAMGLLKESLEPKGETPTWFFSWIYRYIGQKRK
jgi:hypothetical protein